MIIGRLADGDGGWVHIYKRTELMVINRIRGKNIDHKTHENYWKYNLVL